MDDKEQNYAIFQKEFYLREGYWLTGHRSFEPWYDDRADYNTNAASYYKYLARKNKILEIHEWLLNRLFKRNLKVTDTKSIDLTKTGDWINNGTCPPDNYDNVIDLKADVIVSNETESRELTNVSPYIFNVPNGSKIKNTGVWSPDYFSLISSIDSEIGIIENNIGDIYNKIDIINNDITNIYNQLEEAKKQIINNTYNGVFTLFTTEVTKVKGDEHDFYIPHFNSQKEEGNLPLNVFSQTEDYSAIKISNTTSVPLLITSAFNCSMETDMALSACYIVITKDNDAIGQSPFITPSTYDQQVQAEPFILQPNQTVTMRYYFRVGGANNAFLPIFGGTGDIYAVLNPDDDDPATQRNFFNVTAQSITTREEGFNV